MSENKILKLEEMKYLSIDEIIRLYQDGYTIETMQYGTYCSGSSVQDRVITDASSNSANLNIYTAYAQKVMPSSKCLQNVVLKLTRVLSDSDIYVEVRPHNTSTGFPQGDPQSSGHYILGSGQFYYRVPITSVSTTPTDITCPLNVLLSDNDITNGIWIVVSLWIYDPTVPDATVHAKVGNGVSGTTGEHMAFKDNGLAWQGSNTWNLYFRTNKQTYAAPLTSINITPTTASINEGASQQLVATCNITCPTLTWTTSASSVATVSGTGLVTGQNAGTANITAGASGITSNTSVITVVPVLNSITIGPPSATLNIGGTQQLTATCTDIRNSSMTCPTLTWSSSNTSVATVNSTGLVTAISAGNANITASASGKISNSSVITVKTLGSISLNPISATRDIGGTVQVTSTCKDNQGYTMTCPTLTWSSSNTSVATVNSTGLVTAISAGNANITAASGTITSNTFVITVRAPSTLSSISVYPASTTIGINATQQYTPVCKDQLGTTITCPTLTWASSNPSIASIDSNGLAKGLSVGVSNITASAQGITSSNSTLAVSGTAPSTGMSPLILLGIAAIGGLGLILFTRRK